MDEVGTLIQLPASQIITINNLEDFLTREPNVKPFVNFVKLGMFCLSFLHFFIVILEDAEPEPKYFDVEKGLKKEDTVRSNVKQSFQDQLMTRAKASKVGVSRKATKELSEQIEIELYRLHKSVKSPKYRSWCADFLSQITNVNNVCFYPCKFF